MPRAHRPTATSFTFQDALFFLFSILFFITPFVFTWMNEELFEFNKMLFTYAMTLIIGGVWIARMIHYRKIIFRRTIFDVPIVLFLCSQLLSTFFSIHIPTSIFGYYTRFHGGLLSTLTYICLYYAAVSNLEKKHLPGLLMSTFSSAFIVTVLAIPEHFGHSFSCLLINSNQLSAQHATDVWNLGTMWRNYNVSCWIQDVQDRIFATFGQPNWLAAYAITLLPLSMVVANRYYLNDMIDSEKLDPPQRLSRVIFYSLTSILLFMTLLFTKSRSGFLGFAVSMLLFAGVEGWLYWRSHKKMTVSSLPAPLLIIVSAFLLISVYFGTPYSPSISKYFTSSQAAPAAAAAEANAPVVNRLEVGGTDSAEIRRIVWTGAIRVWKRYPLFGSGVETFAYSYYLDRPMEHNNVSEWDFLYNKAHNEWLNYLATTGTVGFLSYLVLLSFFIGLPAFAVIAQTKNTAIEKALKHPWIADTGITFPSSSANVSVCAALSGGLIALTISNFFGFSTVMVGILLFIFPAFFVFLTSPPPEQLSVTKKTETDQIVGFVFVGIVVLWLLLSLRTTWVADKNYAIGKSFNQAGQVSNALTYLQDAVRLSPNEDVYKEELSLAYARAAVVIADQRKDATVAAQVAKEAVDTSNQILADNPVHLNFYKTKVRVLLTLAPLSDQFVWQAKDTLLKATQLAPTDPKLVFNLAVIELSLNLSDDGFTHLQQAVQMKPNYEAARMSLAEELEKRAQYDAAQQQYEYILQYIQPNNQQAQQRLELIKKGSASFGPKAPKVAPSAASSNGKK